MTDTRVVPVARLQALEDVAFHAGIAHLEAVQGDGGWWVPDLTFNGLREAVTELYRVERRLRDEAKAAERESVEQMTLVA